jgi:hypothetical protein
VVATTLAVSSAALSPGAAAPGARQPPPAVAPAPVVSEWQLRGVAIGASGPIAVLEHRASGRDEVVRVGDRLGDGLAVIAIDPERVVLEADGQDVTLRLGHGGQARGAPPPPAHPRWPRSRWRDRR